MIRIMFIIILFLTSFRLENFDSITYSVYANLPIFRWHMQVWVNASADGVCILSSLKIIKLRYLFLHINCPNSKSFTSKKKK